jgi:hypothetical protein
VSGGIIAKSDFSVSSAGLCTPTIFYDGPEVDKKLSLTAPPSFHTIARGKRLFFFRLFFVVIKENQK